MRNNPWKIATFILVAIIAAGAGILVGIHVESPQIKPVAQQHVTTVRPTVHPKPRVSAKPTSNTMPKPKPSPTASYCGDSCNVQVIPQFVTASYVGTEPSTIDISDSGSSYITGITWTEWNSSEAIGYGRHGIDDCTPNCAIGSYTYYPSTITLSDPMSAEPEIFGQMTETYGGQTINYSYPSTWPAGAS